ncbi:uncharacterized protein DUF2786 [Paucimonas lemoignei]|uniref:Uncharacterized protein DUF2786 n=1 Tax=Paucimonas lemoignei TaxID=29443 RepID=A0A4R3I1B5_PAULE|nr:DUF2786 domain-containing protein [Paucimonas lemoignei]TCS38491.1 uncharacterized protein DUF2786 [Paucimonas lemoignei]
MDKNTALNKIKKCLRLAKSANEHEAAAALRQAQKLMAEHGVSADDIEMMEVSEQMARATSSRIINWEAALAGRVAAAFGCEVIACRRRTFMRPTLYYSFIGCGAAPEVAQYAFTVLLRQCKAARAAHIKIQPRSCKPATKTARGDVFAYAWVVAVASLIDSFSQSEANTNAIALYKAAHFPNAGKSEVTDRVTGRNIRNADAEAGYEAGKAAQLNRGVSGMEERKALQA